jgi:hypothetical protein
MSMGHRAATIKNPTATVSGIDVAIRNGVTLIAYYSSR